MEYIEPIKLTEEEEKENFEAFKAMYPEIYSPTKNNTNKSPTNQGGVSSGLEIRERSLGNIGSSHLPVDDLSDIRKSSQILKKESSDE